MRWHRWGRRWGGWPGYSGRWGGGGWRRRGFGCFPCCSLILLIPLLVGAAWVISLAVHHL